jgi:hypothetical protein
LLIFSALLLLATFELSIAELAPLRGGPISIVAVVEFTEFLEDACVFGSGDGTGPGGKIITLFTPGTVKELKFKVEVGDTTLHAYSDINVFETEQRYHLVSTASVDGLAVYIDGAVAKGANAVYTSSNAEPPAIARTVVYVGKSTTGGGFLKGRVSSITVYSVALTAGEVEALYDVHATTATPSAAPTAGPTAGPTGAPTAAPTHPLGSLVNVEPAAIVVREDGGDGPRTLLSVNLAGAPLALGPDEEATVRCTTESDVVAIDAPASHAVRATSSASTPMTIAARGVRDAEQVGFLLCTVTFYANHAHSLTRSP